APGSNGASASTRRSKTSGPSRTPALASPRSTLSSWPTPTSAIRGGRRCRTGDRHLAPLDTDEREARDPATREIAVDLRQLVVVVGRRGVAHDGRIARRERLLLRAVGGLDHLLHRLGGRISGGGGRRRGGGPLQLLLDGATEIDRTHTACEDDRETDEELSHGLILRLEP